MSRKNNSKLYQARHAAALERNKERNRRSEARRVRRQHMRLLTEGLANLECFARDKSPVSSAAAACAPPSCVPVSSLSSSLAAPFCHSLAAVGGEDRRSDGSAAPVANCTNTPESTAAQNDAGQLDPEVGRAQQRRGENRVRKSIWKGASGGRLVKCRENSKHHSSAAGKKDRSKQKRTVLVRGKSDGMKVIIRARDKKVLKQMDKRRKRQLTSRPRSRRATS